MLYLVGLGLGDAKDITLRGLETVRACDRVYLESYTSVLTASKESLESLYGREVIVADRDACEDGADTMLDAARDGDVALLVVGDPLGATTHADLLLRARERGVQYKVIQNASIVNAVACCGLQLYSFGETVSIPFWTDTWRPDSFFDKIVENFNRGLHTLCLLDIKVKEPTEESLTKKVKVYAEPRFMSVAQASRQLLAITEAKSIPDIDGQMTTVGLARVGSDSQKIIVLTLKEMCDADIGPPLHTLVVPAKRLHPLEEEFLNIFR